ncbi:hypothetical protein [Hymenobacter koreensis]
MPSLSIRFLPGCPARRLATGLLSLLPPVAEAQAQQNLFTTPVDGRTPRG